MALRLSGAFIEDAIGQDLWDLGNELLYSLCRDHPRHDLDKVVAAKIWLIGRSYSASIERRRARSVHKQGDVFYEGTVVPGIRRSRIDEWIDDLRSSDPCDDEALCVAHCRTTRLFKRISGASKRSLASKYLHFHVPSHVFLYDSRAAKAVRRLVPRRLPGATARRFDSEYHRFVVRCREAKASIEACIGRPVTLRELDKVLLATLRRRRH
jgi:hypothetical protein